MSMTTNSKHDTYHFTQLCTMTSENANDITAMTLRYKHPIIKVLTHKDEKAKANCTISTVQNREPAWIWSGYEYLLALRYA